MKYILFALILLCSCKKKEIKNVPNHVIKYEVIGTCCDLEVWYLEGTLKTYTSTNYFKYEYTFNAQSGTALEIRGRSAFGAEFTNVKIFQDGALLQEAQGYNTQTLTDVVK